jgi:site-specific DNA recombinase
VERAVELTADPTTRPGSASRWLLTGIAVCGRCGTTMSAAQHSKGTRYSCGAYNVRQGQHMSPGHVAMLTAHLDAVVTEQLLSAVRGGLLRRVDLAQPHTPDLATSAVIEATQARLTSVNREYAYGGLDHAERKRLRRPLLDTLRDAESSRAERVDAARLRQLGRAPKQFAEVWPALALRERRALMRTCADQISVDRHRGGNVADPGRIKIIWRA